MMLIHVCNGGIFNGQINIFPVRYRKIVMGYSHDTITIEVKFINLTTEPGK